MALDPFQGQEVYAGEVPEPPLSMRMLENVPGIATGIAFNAARGSNTIMSGGGFLDDAKMFKNKKATKFGAFRRGSIGLDPADISSGKSLVQYGSIKRSTTNAAGQMRDPFLRSSRINNVTTRPRAFRRMSSLSVFSEGQSGLYSYAGGIRGLGKARVGPLGRMADKLGVGPDEALLGPGLFSAISAGRSMDKIERRVLAGGRGSKKLAKADRSIQRILSMNNPSVLAQGPLQSPIQIARSMAGIPGSTGVLPASERLAAARALLAPTEAYRAGIGSMVQAGTAVGKVGVRGNLLASAMPGKGTQFLGGFVRGAAGYADAGGLLTYAQKGATRAVQSTRVAMGSGGLVGKSGAHYIGREGAQNLLERGLFKELGIKGSMKFARSAAGAKVAASRALYGASKALPVIGQAMLAYDLARMGGEVVKSGINLARDAEKSLQGSFNKSTFGMGYRDTQAAATSRSRGVMAIQNSRLNARSALGSEAGMMSAHFG
jgi:hypothetical protein